MKIINRAGIPHQNQAGDVMRKLLIFILLCPPVMGAYTQQDAVNGGTDGSTSVFHGSYSLYHAGKITPTSSYTLTKLTLYLIKVGSPTAEIRAAVYNASGTSPGSSLGVSLNTIAASTLTTSEAAYEWTFSGVSLTSGTVYYAVIYYDSPASDASNYVKIYYYGSVASRQQQNSSDAITWSNVSAYQVKFITYSGSEDATTSTTSTSTTSTSTTTSTAEPTTSTTSTTSTTTTTSTVEGATTSTIRKKRMLTMGVG